MNCPHCGTSNLDNASICANCGRAIHVAPPPPPPPRVHTAIVMPPAGPVPNYLIQSIFATLCCCLPLGVVAIIFGAQVNSKLTAGDYAGALDASRKAKQFSLAAIAFGILWIIIAFLINGAAILQQIRANM